MSLEDIGWSTVIRTLIHFTDIFQDIIHRNWYNQGDSSSKEIFLRKATLLMEELRHKYNLMDIEEDIRDAAADISSWRRKMQFFWELKCLVNFFVLSADGIGFYASNIIKVHSQYTENQSAIKVEQSERRWLSAGR